MPDGTKKCIQDEIPFELPKGWTWCRLGSVAFYKKGPFGSSITKAMFVPDSDTAIKVYEQKNAIDKDETLGSYFISLNKFDELKSFEVFPDDIIVSCAGTIGETFVMPSNIRRGIINQALMRIMLYDKALMDFYLLYFDFVLKADAQKYAKGTAIKNIPPFDILKQFLMPIPPIAEQKRIISSIKDFEKYLTDVDNNKVHIQTLVSVAKSKILSLAISGKLVKQDPNEEPASVLLERIRSEKEKLVNEGKIKRGKGDSAIIRSGDNCYYEKLPDGWAVCRLGDVCEIARGGSPRPIQDYITDDSNGINWIKIGDTTQGNKYITEAHEKIRPEGLTHSRFVRAGDFLLTNSMSFGRPYILKIDGCIHDGWLVINDVQRVFTPDFLYHLLSSDWAYQSLSVVAYGSTVKNLKSDTVKTFTVPIPPIAEQYRIVAVIEAAFEQLDNIAAALM